MIVVYCDEEVKHPLYSLEDNMSKTSQASLIFYIERHVRPATILIAVKQTTAKLQSAKSTEDENSEGKRQARDYIQKKINDILYKIFPLSFSLIFQRKIVFLRHKIFIKTKLFL